MNQLNQTQQLQQLLTELGWANENLAKLKEVKAKLPAADAVEQQQQVLNGEKYNASIKLLSAAWFSKHSNVRDVAQQVGFSLSAEQASQLDGELDAYQKAQAAQHQLQNEVSEEARLTEKLSQVKQERDDCDEQMEVLQQREKNQQEEVARARSIEFRRMLSYTPGIVLVVITAVLSIEYLVA